MTNKEAIEFLLYTIGTFSILMIVLGLSSTFWGGIAVLIVLAGVLVFSVIITIKGWKGKRKPDIVISRSDLDEYEDK